MVHTEDIEDRIRKGLSLEDFERMKESLRKSSVPTPWYISLESKDTVKEVLSEV
jgi:hypothetical protein